MKQKITSLVMALIMTASLFMSISVNAENDGTITVSDVKATAGSTIAVPVKIDDNPGILGAELTITFDEGLTLLEGINGNALATHNMTPPGTFTSGCKFVWDKTELTGEDITDDVLLTLKFKTPADAEPGTKYNVSVSYDNGEIMNKDEISISPDIINGSIEIMNLVYGDLDFDGNINATDLVLMRRHVASGYDQVIDELSADVNTDGEIDITDVILLRRYIVGGYGVTFPYTGGGTAPDESTDPNAVKFAASSIHSIDENIIKVLNENSSDTLEYTLDQNCEFYVNDVSIDFDTINQYLQDQRSTITLIDEEDPATDSIYDKIMVDYYNVARVASVISTTSSVRIRTNQLGTIAWNTNETTATVDIIKDNKYISYNDIKEDDIILVRYDPTVTDISESSHIKIYVSDKTVTGTAEGMSTVSGKEYLLVDGEKYKFDDPSQISNIESNKAYTLYLDAMGYVYDYEVVEEPMNIGIVAQMYQVIADDTPTVKLIDTNGDIQTYLTKTTADAASIDTFDGTTDNTIVKLCFDPNTLNQRFIEYRISDGMLVYESTVAPDTADGMFMTSTSKLGSYTINETATTILDLDAYLNDDGEPAVYPYSKLENECEYTGYVADRSTKTGIYRFAVLTNGTSSLRPTSSLAVVTSCGIMKSVKGVNVEALTVARNGEENVEVLVRDMGVAPEGSIIMYIEGSEGYVESGKLKVIYSPTASYDALATSMFAAVSSDTLFTSYAANSMIIADADGYTLSVGGTTDVDVEIFIAPVYSATSSVLQILTSKEYRSDLMSTVSNIATNIEAFSLEGANLYTYNYDKATGDGISVSVGGVTQKSNIFNGNYADINSTAIDWSAVLTDAVCGDAEPMVAFARVNDGKVTDVIYYVAS